MIRIFDLALSTIGLIILFPIFILLCIIGLFDTGSPLFIQERLGLHQKSFKLIKFRTMKIGTAEVGTHLASKSSITKFGSFLRKTKLDELPQLLNVFKGDMSLVGPRPGLPTQGELKKERDKRGIFNIKPGITGIAQIKGVDMSTPRKLAKYDQLMTSGLTTSLYFTLIGLTVLGKGSGDKVKND